jgi:hypothetical protein
MATEAEVVTLRGKKDVLNVDHCLTVDSEAT